MNMDAERNSLRDLERSELLPRLLAKGLAMNRAVRVDIFWA